MANQEDLLLEGRLGPSTDDGALTLPSRGESNGNAATIAPCVLEVSKLFVDEFWNWNFFARLSESPGELGQVEFAPCTEGLRRERERERVLPREFYLKNPTPPGAAHAT